MVPRVRMMQEMESINEKIITMAEQVESDIIKAVKALQERDIQLANQIIDTGDLVDDLEEEIQQECFNFLATQSPVGSDLRYCVSIMKMIRDLERIGDHCEDLAKYTMRLENADYGQELINIPRMADMSAKMVSNAITAFLTRDLRMARKVWKADEEMDELFRTVYDQQIALATQKQGNTEVYIMFAFVAAHLERIADYATNICEETVFSLEGEVAME
jgi:phosphate transport system protein